jgi:hypothetical protein
VLASFGCFCSPGLVTGYSDCWFKFLNFFPKLESEPEPELELASGLKLDFESKLAPVYQVSRSGEKKKVVQKNLIKILLKK